MSGWNNQRWTGLLPDSEDVGVFFGGIALTLTLSVDSQEVLREAVPK